MISFKLKLVVYFLLLSLLPFAAAFIGFTSVAQRSETRLVDARLQAGLRASIAAYGEELDAAARAASALARDPEFQRALRRHDRVTLRRMLAASPNLRVESGDFRFGREPQLAAERQVAVLGGGGAADEMGVVIASVPLDRTLLERIRDRSGLETGEHVVIMTGNRIVVGSTGVGGMLDAPSGRTATVRIGGSRYRALTAATPGGDADLTLAVLSPQSRIDEANRSAGRRLLLGLALSLLLVLVVAYLEGRSIVRTVRTLVEAANAIARGKLSERVPVRGRDELALLARSFNEMAEQLEERLEDLEAERKRVREATLRFGEALAATHDIDGLLRAIVEAAVESTSATGGLLVGSDGSTVEFGDPDREANRFELPLVAGHANFGTLVLSGPEFSVQDIETAALLVGHAVVALENARLHRIVERQARVDELTELANRREAEDVLESELSRAHRFGDSLAFVLADLDDFKGVNDRYGHPFGDLVLREFAEVLSETVREIDVAARWGGEEFALVLPGTELDGAVHLAERVRAALAERTIVTPEGDPLPVTASFGVAAYPAAPDGEALVGAADTALYAAKRGGKDRVVAAPEGGASVARPNLAVTKPSPQR